MKINKSPTLGYVHLIKKWRLKAKEYMKAHRGETGCVPCEKIIIADTLKMCARELKESNRSGCKYYYLKQRDEFRSGDEFQNYSWTKTYYPIPKEWYGDEKHKHLSYRTRVRRSI